MYIFLQLDMAQAGKDFIHAGREIKILYTFFNDQISDFND